ncbi:MAG: response regulator [Anaerolineae bacterium]|nr:response regulator [Anaerolineae bacterium]
MIRRRILVVEDDVDIAEMLVTFLSGQGYEVFHVLTGADAIAEARAKFPNLILLDVMLPDMDGFDVARALRRTALTRHLPMMFLTERNRRSDKVTGLLIGADDYIPKPFDLGELALRVRGAIERATREQLYDPNTGLPTKIIIDADRLSLSRRLDCTEIDLHIAGLRHFHDVYGFIATGQLLQFFSYTVTETIATLGTIDDLAGVYNEDHYVLFTMTPHINHLVSTLKHRFDDGSKCFYNFIDRDRGYLIIGENGGKRQTVPLMQLTISRITPAAKLVTPQSAAV